MAGASFTVVSNDCWSAEIYRYLNRPYNTPFVGLFLYGPDYARLLGDLDRNVRGPLDFGSSRWVSAPTYPVGLLADEIEIHFLHYGSAEQARDTWHRRSARMDWDELRIKLSTGKEG